MYMILIIFAYLNIAQCVFMCCCLLNVTTFNQYDARITGRVFFKIVRLGCSI